MREIEATHPEAARIDLWYQDEARVGQKGRLTRRWYQRGMRPRALRDHRFGSAYIFGATCPERDIGVAIVVTRASTKAMNLLLAEIAQALPPGTHAVLLMDNAGWHIADEIVVPPTITLVPLPPYSPELNAIERVCCIYVTASSQIPSSRMSVPSSTHAAMHGTPCSPRQDASNHSALCHGPQRSKLNGNGIN